MHRREKTYSSDTAATIFIAACHQEILSEGSGEKLCVESDRRVE